MRLIALFLLLIGGSALAAPNNISHILLAGKEGDTNAKYRQVVKTTHAHGNVTLTVRDSDTGKLFTFTQPAGTNVVARSGKKGETEVLTRLPSAPEHIDMEEYAFPTSNIATILR
jgi:hypothetical protein